MKRTVYSIAVTLFTFLIGTSSTMLWVLPQKAERPSVLPTSESVTKSSIAEHQVSEKEPLFKELKFPRVCDEAMTVAGKMEILEPEIFKWKVSLDGKEILHDNGDLSPSIWEHIKGRVSGFDEVIILSQYTGTCCEFGKFWVLGLRGDKSYYLSQAIGDGFAHVPEVIVGDDYVKVKIRSGYMPNVPKREGYLPGGTWELRNGHVKKRS